MNPKSFFAELKRRNVYKVAAAYAIVAWLLMQGVSQIPWGSGLRDDPRYKNLVAKVDYPKRHEQQTIILFRAKAT